MRQRRMPQHLVRSCIGLLVGVAVLAGWSRETSGVVGGQRHTTESLPSPSTPGVGQSGAATKSPAKFWLAVWYDTREFEEAIGHHFQCGPYDPAAANGGGGCDVWFDDSWAAGAKAKIWDSEGTYWLNSSADVGCQAYGQPCGPARVLIHLPDPALRQVGDIIRVYIQGDNEVLRYQVVQ
jgi:hypothetical protein